MNHIMHLNDHLKFWEYHDQPVITFNDGKKEWVFVYQKTKGPLIADFIKKNATPLNALDYEKKYGDLIYVHEWIRLKYLHPSQKSNQKQKQRIQLLEKIIHLYEEEWKYKPVPIYLAIGDTVVIFSQTFNAHSLAFQFSPYGIQSYNPADAMWQGDVIPRELAWDKIDQMNGLKKSFKKTEYYDQFSPPFMLYGSGQTYDQYLSLANQSSYAKKANQRILKHFKSLALIECPLINKQLLQAKNKLQKLTKL